ncbi:MAG: MaoC family dehydratase [Chloroflexota bacterium]|nr:MaoC family dehydratase [Dehalococcoidia bacterium]MDW8254685.1 MaoC family dehydratase [Chloroflexota bacterium]
MQTLPATRKSGPPGSAPDVSFFDIELGPRGPYQVTVTEEDIARWSRIYADDHPWYSGPSPWGGPIAPPSILYYPSQMFLGRYLIGNSPGATRSGGFARYALDCLGPIPVGRPLVVTGEVFDKFVRRGRGYVYYRLEASAAGRLVQRHWKSWAFGLADEEAARSPEKPSEPREDVAGDAIATLAPLRFEITLARMAEFEGPDERNVHTDPALAKQTSGQPPLAQGALSFGLLSRLLTNHFGAGYLEGGSLDVRFIARVFAGETILAGGEIVRRENGVARLRVWCAKEDGTLVTVGTASARERP